MTVLPIPNPLTTDYIAPAGAFTAPPQVNVNASVKIDLTKAQITGGGTGWLFKPKTGVNVYCEAGQINNMTGICFGFLGLNGRASFELVGGLFQDVKQLIGYKLFDGGRLDGTIREVEAHNIGAGIRTWGSARAYRSKLYGGNVLGGGGDPGAIRALDLNPNAIVVPDQVCIVDDCDIDGFIVAGQNVDGVNAEETCAYMQVTNSRISNIGDAPVDSKADKTVIANNHIYGSAGSNRLVANHIGRMLSTNNVFDVPAYAYAFHSSSGYGSDPLYPDFPGLISVGDKFNLLDVTYATSKVGHAVVACKGSTGFSTTRCGRQHFINADWGPRLFTDVMTYLHAVCADDGLEYHPFIDVE